jgi:hypothetical protein
MNDIVLAALRTRITGVFPDQIRVAIAPLTDEQLWWRPNESSNSIANLMLHLTGSLNYFLNRNLGGLEAEFAARGMMPKAEVLALFDEMTANATRTFDDLTPEGLSAPSPEQAMVSFVVEDLVNILAHIAAHTGQILWIAKMLTDGGLDDVWMKSHRSQGAWKRKSG